MNLRSCVYSVIYAWGKLINLPSIFMNRIIIGNNVNFRGKVLFKTVNRKPLHSIIIGNNVNVNSSLKSDPIGGDTKTILYTKHDGVIRIGNGVGISNTTIVAESSVTIGDYSNIGGSTKIYDTDFHSLNPHIRLNGDNEVKSKPIVIGARVFIGAHCIIMKGVTIGDNSIIGAGSVVVKSVPSNEIWAGNPARFIKKLEI